jgi:hypothetical protein
MKAKEIYYKAKNDVTNSSPDKLVNVPYVAFSKYVTTVNEFKVIVFLYNIDVENPFTYTAMAEFLKVNLNSMYRIIKTMVDRQLLIKDNNALGINYDYLNTADNLKYFNAENNLY